ncbi:tyrosine-type recombinase/integrase, partial [Niveispirillum sp. KHB5.9]|uniref:tyrosine-type recombinase/integrase n=1 Tax=Niveispirillum sp. KHB5.9 TaxID=3400269 RepID=UPI003A8BF88B
IISATQVNAVLGVLAGNRHPARDRVMFLLSVKAGLRAKEIAQVTWGMVLTADGQLSDSLHLEDRAAKMGSGRFVPLNRDLREALMHLRAERQPKPEDTIIFSERGRSMSAPSVVRWFWDLYENWASPAVHPIAGVVPSSRKLPAKPAPLAGRSGTSWNWRDTRIFRPPAGTSRRTRKLKGSW